jgi:hypothetical protein
MGRRRRQPRTAPTSTGSRSNRPCRPTATRLRWASSA